MTHSSMNEKRVIDSEGIELGVVSKVENDYIEISEGLFDELLLNKSYLGQEKEEEVVLRGSIQDLFEGLDIKDSNGQRMGSVKETVFAGDILDTLIIETTDKDLLFVTLEEIYKIDEAITLDIDLKEVVFRQKTHTLRDRVIHYLEKKRSH